MTAQVRRGGAHISCSSLTLVCGVKGVCRVRADIASRGVVELSSNDTAGGDGSDDVRYRLDEVGVADDVARSNVGDRLNTTATLSAHETFKWTAGSF